MKKLIPILLLLSGCGLVFSPDALLSPRARSIVVVSNDSGLGGCKPLSTVVGHYGGSSQADIAHARANAKQDAEGIGATHLLETDITIDRDVSIKYIAYHCS